MLAPVDIKECNYRLKCYKMDMQVYKNLSIQNGKVTFSNLFLVIFFLF